MQDTTSVQANRATQAMYWVNRQTDPKQLEDIFVIAAAPHILHVMRIADVAHLRSGATSGTVGTGMDKLKLARGEDRVSDRSSSGSDLSSDCDDSQLSSSCDDFESPPTTPRSQPEDLSKVSPDTTPEHLGMQSTMKPKVPILGLRQDANIHMQGPAAFTPRKGSQPDTARGRPAIPGLALKEGSGTRAAPALPPIAPPSSRRSTARTRPPSGAESDSHSDTGTVSISLISQGLSVSSSSQEGRIEAGSALRQISRQLGIRQSEVKLFQLQEVQEPCSLASGGGQYAVAINNSREATPHSVVLPAPSDCLCQARCLSILCPCARFLPHNS